MQAVAKDRPEPMVGFPPPPSTRIGPENWSRLPGLRWSLLNRARQLPNVALWRGDGAVLALPPAGQDLASLPVTPEEGARAEPLDALLSALHADAIVVLHRGRLAWERYWHGMQPQDRHMLASVSKGLCGLLAGILADAGVVQLDRPLSHYVPEVAGRPIDATLRQLLDMTAAIARPPMTWRDPVIGGQDGGLYEALGLLPAREGAPQGVFDMVATRPADPAGAGHGRRFFYDNAPTEAVSWALARATGTDPALLLQDLLWRHIGAERDAFVVIDRQSMPSLSGGVATTARDLARLGEVLRRGGAGADGRQLVPEAFLADLLKGGDPAQFAPTQFARDLPGGSYRSFWYLGHDSHGTIQGHGRYGQRLWISPRAELVVALFSSIPGPPPQPEARALARIWRALAAHFTP